MLPKELLTHTVENLYAARGGKANLIYGVVISLILAGIFLLPLIRVEMTVRSPAVIRPAINRTSIRALVSGVVQKTLVEDNMIVKVLDTLYVLESNTLLQKEQYLRQRALELSYRIDDIRELIAYVQNEQPFSLPLVKTQYYRQSWSQLRQKQNDAARTVEKVTASYKRAARLHEENVIADAEFENNRFELDKSRQDLSAVKTLQLSQWRTDEISCIREYEEVQFELAQAVREKEHYIIRAPCSGTVMSTHGIYQGTIVSQGMDLMEISPDTSLITEAYVSPNDIGLLRDRMPVSFQVDAFNYNDWGLAYGTIIDISSDVINVGDRPVFKVRCAMAKDYLTLRNGYKGSLKKGMTLVARFNITERSVWQLLFDKVDDWLNPQVKTGRV